MNVELSAATLKKAEQLVHAGAYPDVESAIAAALDSFEPSRSDWVDPFDAEAEEDFALGRFRTVDAEFLAELRAKAEAIIAAKTKR